MSGPWEKYATPAPANPGPWAKYANQSAPQTAPEEPDMSFRGRLRDNWQGVDDGVTSPGEWVAGTLNKAGQGLMFGFGDEADSALRTLINGKSYDENLAAFRENEQRFEEAHPVTSTVAEIGGAVLPALSGVGVAGNSVRAGMAIGAGQGGAHGFGNAEGGFHNRAQSAAVGAGLGGALGGAVSGISSGVRGVADRVRTSGAIKSAAVDAPSSDQLRAAGNAAYDQIENSGVQIKPEAFSALQQRLIQKLQSETGFDSLPGPGSLTPNAARGMQIMEQASDEMAAVPRAALPFKSFDQMRRQASAAAGNVTNKTDQHAGTAMIGEMDSFIENLGPEDVLAGDAQVLKTAIPKAREIWQRLKKSELIDNAISQEGNYVSGGASAIRNQFAQLLRNPKLSKGFSEAEKAALRRVVQGTPTENLVNLLGGGMGSLGQMGVGASFGLPGFALGALSAAGTRKLSENITRRNAERARAAIASGKLTDFPAITNRSAFQVLLEDMTRRGGNANLN